MTCRVSSTSMEHSIGLQGFRAIWWQESRHLLGLVATWKARQVPFLNPSRCRVTCLSPLRFWGSLERSFPQKMWWEHTWWPRWSCVVNSVKVAELWEIFKNEKDRTIKILPLLAGFSSSRVQKWKKRFVLTEITAGFWWGDIGSVILLILEKESQFWYSSDSTLRWINDEHDEKIKGQVWSGFSLRAAELQQNMPRWSWKMTWQNSSPNGKNWWPWNDAQYCTRSVGIKQNITTTT